jgi:hypothetical protein
MKTISISYILFATAAIGGLFTMSNLFRQYLSHIPTVEYFEMVAHGASIVLFFHLVGKIAGISFYWRVAVDMVLPTLGFAFWFTMLRDSSGDKITFPFSLVVGAYLIKFSVSAIAVELAMRSLEKRWGMLKPPRAKDKTRIARSDST